jgi:cytochrome c oxidase cbb3-type subunit 2
MNRLLAIVGGSAAVYLVLALAMGVFPGIELSHTAPGPGVQPLSALQAQGREIYVANGCSYCHTQQVRPLAEDRVFGRPSARGDFAYQTPELLGSERTGPDLINVGVRRGSDVWQYMHLYNPRAVVPESIMPSFAWLFQVVDNAPPGVAAVPLPPPYAPAHGVVIPTPQARALVAYLLSLQQAPLPGAAGAAAGAAGMAGMPGMAEAATAAAAGAAGASGPAGAAAAAPAAGNGEQLFSANCAACHQATGAGLPGAFPALKDNAVVNDADPAMHIHTVLFGLHGTTIGGVPYSAQMPPFGTQLNDQEVAALINYERSAWGNHGKPVTAAEVAAIRSKGK